MYLWRKELCHDVAGGDWAAIGCDPDVSVTDAADADWMCRACHRRVFMLLLLCGVPTRELAKHTVRSDSPLSFLSKKTS